MKPNLKLVSSRPSEKVFGSPEFIARGRNVELAKKPPTKFVPTVKGPGDVTI